MAKSNGLWQEGQSRKHHAPVQINYREQTQIKNIRKPKYGSTNGCADSKPHGAPWHTQSSKNRIDISRITPFRLNFFCAPQPVLDMSFNEDQSRIRKQNAPQIMAVIQHMALNLLQLMKYKMKKQSIKRLRKMAGWDELLLSSILSQSFS